jgi:hypothetical protein
MKKLIAIISLVLIFSIIDFSYAQAPEHHRGFRGWRKEKMRKMMPMKAEEEYLKFLQDNGADTQTLNGFKKLKEENPRMYGRVVFKGCEFMHGIMPLKDEAPETYKKLAKIGVMEAKSLTLAQNYKETTDEKKKESIKSQLSTLLNQLFDLKLEAQQLRIQKMEKEIAKLKELIDIKNKHRNEVIKRRLDTLIGEGQYLEW